MNRKATLGLGLAAAAAMSTSLRPVGTTAHKQPTSTVPVQPETADTEASRRPTGWKRARPMPGRADKDALDRDYDNAIAKRDRKNAKRDRCWTGVRGQPSTSGKGDHHD